LGCGHEHPEAELPFGRKPATRHCRRSSPNRVSAFSNSSLFISL
jgi:hypothetical protein